MCSKVKTLTVRRRHICTFPLQEVPTGQQGALHNRSLVIQLDAKTPVIILLSHNCGHVTSFIDNRNRFNKVNPKGQWRHYMSKLFEHLCRQFHFEMLMKIFRLTCQFVVVLQVRSPSWRPIPRVLADSTSVGANDLLHSPNEFYKSQSKLMIKIRKLIFELCINIFTCLIFLIIFGIIKSSEYQQLSM